MYAFIRFVYMRVYLMRSFVSEIFTIKDSVTLSKNLVSLGSQVELLTQVAHIEEFFVVFLEEAK